jgi:S-adenosylmethionine uptake transporter
MMGGQMTGRLRAGAPGRDDLRGAALMMGSMAAFVLNDACVKWLAQGMPTFQAVTLRGVAATALLIALARATGALSRPIPAAERGRVALRVAAEIGAFLPFVVALQHMPLANVTAILQALPLTIAAAGALFLGERVGPRRWACIALGFAGVLMIVRPGLDGFDAWALLALLSVALITLRDVVTRRLSAEVPSLKVAILTAAGVTLLALVLSVGEPWQMPDPRRWAAIGAAACFILGGYLFSVMAVRAGEVSFVAPFRYTALIWALLLGWLVFGDWPDGPTLLGAALIAAAGAATVLMGGGPSGRA